MWCNKEILLFNLKSDFLSSIFPHFLPLPIENSNVVYGRPISDEN